MTVVEATKTKTSSGAARSGRLFLLDLSGGRVLSMDPNGSNRSIIATDCPHPDGVVVDVAAGHVYWTNMGAVPSRNDGSIERADIDGKNRRFIVAPGGTFTPKQLHLDRANGKLYWSDREGMRVMRSNLDGSQIETLVQTGEGETDRHDQERWCVGIAVDPERRQIYWTQKGGDNAGVGRILRAGIEIDLEHRILYWTDRGNPPRGNTVNRAPIDAKPTQNAPQIVVSDLMEGIGIALDVPGHRMFVTDLAGSLYAAKLDGTDKQMLLAAQGNLTGIAYVEV
jgi:sugar lactone lactonase YvrE